MFSVFMMILTILLITLMIILFALFTSYKMYLIKEKISPYECGFNPAPTSQPPFSINFFMIALLFIVFDIELILLFPAPFSLLMSNPFTVIFLSTLISILLLGLLYEWYYGSLSWLN